MIVYAVFKHGIYRHECGGIFTTEALAREAACKLLAGEPDKYHHYKVVPFTLDRITNQTPTSGKLSKGDLVEAEPIAIFSTER